MRMRMKKAYYNNTALDCAKDQGSLFNLTNKLLHTTSTPCPVLAHHLCWPMPSSTFLKVRLSRYMTICPTCQTMTQRANTNWPEVPVPATLSNFSTISQLDLEKIITRSPIKTRTLDPIPASLFCQVHKNLLPALTVLINKSPQGSHAHTYSQEGSL